MVARGCRWWQDVTVGTVPITLRNRACVWKYLCRLACTYLGSTILLFLRNSGNTDRILSMALQSDEIDNWKRSITDKIYDKYWDNISTFYLARGKRSIVDIYENIQTVLLCFKVMLGKHWESKNRFIFFSCREEFDRRFLSLFIERTSKSNSSIVLYFYQPDDEYRLSNSEKILFGGETILRCKEEMRCTFEGKNDRVISTRFGGCVTERGGRVVKGHAGFVGGRNSLFEDKQLNQPLRPI